MCLFVFVCSYRLTTQMSDMLQGYTIAYECEKNRLVYRLFQTKLFTRKNTLRFLLLSFIKIDSPYEGCMDEGAKSGFFISHIWVILELT